MCDGLLEGDLGRLRHRLLHENRVGEVLAVLERDGAERLGAPAPARLLAAEARRLDGDFRRAALLYGDLRGADTELPMHACCRAALGLADCWTSLGQTTDAAELLAVLRDAPLDPAGRVDLELLVARHRLYNGQWAATERHASVAWEAAVVVGDRRRELVAESIRLLVLALRGREEESLAGLRRVGHEQVARGNLWWGTVTLLNLSEQLATLRAFVEADRLLERCARQAEIIQSGHIRTLLLVARTWRAVQAGQHDIAERHARKALEALDQRPFFHVSMLAGQQLATALFRQGRCAQALVEARQVRRRAEAAGHALHTGVAAQAEGIFLLRLGDPHEAVRHLDTALDLLAHEIDSRRWVVAGLYAAAAELELGDASRARGRLLAALRVANQGNFLPTYLEAHDVIVPLFMQLLDALPLDLAIIGEIVVRAGHPGLVRRLLRRGVAGKRLFLRSLEPAATRDHRQILRRLAQDGSAVIRRTTRELLEQWRLGMRYRVVLLGPIRVFAGGRLLADGDWKRPQVKRLFLYMAMHADRWLPAEVIMHALWQEPDPNRARRTLSTLVSYLRRAIEPWRLEGEPPRFVRSQQGRYGFFPGERFESDAEEFTRLVTTGQARCRSGAWAEAVAMLGPALDLYVGDYCEEFPYEAWLEARRGELRELYFAGVGAGAQALFELGRGGEACALLERGLHRDPARFELLGLLLDGLDRAGRRGVARHWCRRVLERAADDLDEEQLDWLRRRSRDLAQVAVGRPDTTADR
jgi:DNA-binding SARP family transcriptional activator